MGPQCPVYIAVQLMLSVAHSVPGRVLCEGNVEMLAAIWQIVMCCYWPCLHTVFLCVCVCVFVQHENVKGGSSI